MRKKSFYFIFLEKTDKTLINHFYKMLTKFKLENILSASYICYKLLQQFFVITKKIIYMLTQ